ncbi:M14 family zinc carboxypeptidase [Lutibacter sp.]
MKIKLLLFFVLFAVLKINAQTNRELADKYLKERGELVFTFTANNFDEARKLSSIISFDHGQDRNNPLTIKAIANQKNFNNFLKFNLPFTVDKKQNEPKEVVMFEPKIHKKGILEKNAAYTLTFPLTAYPTYAQYAQQMADFANDHPTIAQLIDIGGTAQGAGGGDKRLLFIKLSDNVTTQEQEPRVMYTSSMHGDEIAGYPMMLSLIDYFITAYNDTGHTDHTRVKNLLDNSEVWINPLANPDGTYFNDATNTSVANAIRGNGNVIDLNRNYPVPSGNLHPDGEVYQTETVNFMTLEASTHFVLSANLHGGAEVVNYPWDYTLNRHPDDTWWQLVSKEYADNVQADGPAGYFTDVTASGYTHGGDWYVIAGGRQDYMNFERHAKEFTLEVSSTKLIAANQIQNHWNYNREALIDYLVQGTYGFRGVVKDASTGTPIKAKVTLVGHDALGSWVETELPFGDYYRPINAGTYDILFEADCYQSFTLTNQTIADYQTVVLADINLTPATASAPINLTASSITTTTATLGWNDAGVTSYDIQYRIVGSPTWTSASSATNSLDLTGLTASTNYEFQVRSICLTASNYSSSSTFTTFSIGQCVGDYITSFPYIESFENGVGLWTQSTTDDIDWTINSGGTPSSNTGPTTASDGTWYLYTEASTNVTPAGSPYKQAVFLSPCFDLSGFKNAQFSFDYHWYGSNIDLATLAVEVSNDNEVSYISLFDKGTGGASLNSWVSSGNLDLTAYNGQTIKLKIIGVTGDGWASDMAIDNFSLTAEVDVPLGIEDELLSEFVVYPNPVTNGEIKLRMPSEIADFTILILNVFGQKVYQKEVTSNYNTLHKVPTANLQSGIYFVTVSTNLGKATKKLIIQ